MRGNWQCCLTPNLTGVLTQTSSGWQPNGNWWAMRDYADMTGSLVSTSGQVGSTAISAAEDSSQKRAVAIIGDSNGYTGSASVTFSGLGSVPWLASNGSVNVVVDRIPDQYPLSCPAGGPEPEHEHVERVYQRPVHLPGLARRIRYLCDAGPSGGGVVSRRVTTI